MNAFQAFELDVIEQVASGPIDLVHKQAVDLLSVGLGVGEHLFEHLPLGALAGGFGYAKELGNGAAVALRLAVQRINLSSTKVGLPD